MGNESLHVEQKIRSIESDYGSSDYEKAKAFHDYMMPSIVENARSLGAANLPLNEEYEQMLTSRYSALYTELVSDEATMAEEVRTSFNQTRENYFNTDEGYLMYEITRIKQNFEKAKVLHGRLIGETNAVSFFLKNTWVVYLILCFIGFLEYPLNQSLFIAFGLGYLGTILLAILVVVIIPILSHLTGKFIKQHRERITNLLLGIGLGTIMLLFVLFLSLFRYKYFEAYRLMETSGIEIFQEAFSKVKLVGAISHTIFWVTFLLNIGLVLIGFVLGFLSHDTKDSFEKAYCAFTFRRPKLIAKLSGFRQNQHTNISIQGKQYMTREQTLSEKMTDFRRMHNALAKHVINLADYMDGLCKEAISSFRLHNQEARRDYNTVPRQWRESPNGFTAVYPKSVTPLSMESYPEIEEQVI